jgi:hypothetical protein
MSEENTVDLEDFVKEEDEEDLEVFDDVKENDFSKFTEWAEAIEQGKLTDDQITDLKTALAELPQGAEGPELELGPNGQTAWQFFSQMGLDDPDLEKKLTASAEVNPDGDPFDAFKTWAQENYPELLVALGVSGEQEPAPAEPAPSEPTAPAEPAAPAPEQPPVAEGKQSSMVKEVAKIVKSFYNRDNPEVGPFRGGEGIALDVEKQISEKFGEQAGQQARAMAEQFMEKLTMEWQQRHGSAQVSGDDGLARLKELVGNIKAKVEGVTQEAGPDKSQVPAYKRKEQGGDWKMSTKDLEKEKTNSPTSSAGLARKKAELGLGQNESAALEAIMRIANYRK